MFNRVRLILCFYRDGFREMVLGRWLWAIILVKLAILFLVLKPLFFPSANRGNPKDVADRISSELIHRIHTP